MEARKRKLILSQHPLYEPEQNTLLWRTFIITLSVDASGDFNWGHNRIQTPGVFFFQLEQ